MQRIAYFNTGHIDSLWKAEMSDTDLSTSSGGEGYGENLVGTSFVVAFLC